MSTSVELGQQRGLWALAPFGLMLVAIAVLPLAAESWFHRNRNKALVALVLGLPTLVYLIVGFGRLGLEIASETAQEYVSFIVMLLALFAVSGGIYLTGNLVATPRTNLAFLAAGAVLASLVAVLFAGIFATMMPALALLQARGQTLGLSQPWQYFWATGTLSSFLDNAPTYLAFTSVAQAQVGAATVGELTSAAVLPGMSLAPAQLLTAVSCGAVLMGAMTYVGNAPSFIVRSIADHSGLRMPSFFGYLGYSVLFLVPIFLVVTALFFI